MLVELEDSNRHYSSFQAELDCLLWWRHCHSNYQSNFVSYCFPNQVEMRSLEEVFALFFPMWSNDRNLLHEQMHTTTLAIFLTFWRTEFATSPVSIAPFSFFGLWVESNLRGKDDNRRHRIATQVQGTWEWWRLKKLWAKKWIPWRLWQVSLRMALQLCNCKNYPMWNTIKDCPKSLYDCILSSKKCRERSRKSDEYYQIIYISWTFEILFRQIPAQCCPQWE